LVGLKTHSGFGLNESFSTECREGAGACRDRNGDGSRDSSSLALFLAIFSARCLCGDLAFSLKGNKEKLLLAELCRERKSTH